jgi:protein phosphatase
VTPSLANTIKRTRRPDPKNTAGARSDVGCIRQHNEDALIVAPPLYAVADGMGGHAAGEVASEIAIQTLVQNAPSIADGDVLIAAMQAANLAIIEATKRGVGKSGMGTTLTALIVDGDHALIGHVGDSRVYLLRNNSLTQLTEDHSLVAELVAIGELTPEQAAIHPKRSIITRALGNDRNLSVDIYRVSLNPQDRILLCTDGLSGMLSDNEICAILNGKGDPQTIADRLTNAALAAGGSDNVSVIVVDIRATRPSKAATAAALAAGTVAQTSAGTDEIEALARRKRRSRLGILTFIVLFLLLVFGAIGGVWLYANNTAFLRLENDVVCVYRGLPGDLLPGVRLEWLEDKTTLSSADLLATTAEEMEKGIRYDSLNAAYARVADLQAIHDQRIAEEEQREAEAAIGQAGQGEVAQAATGQAGQVAAEAEAEQGDAQTEAEPAVDETAISEGN